MIRKALLALSLLALLLSAGIWELSRRGIEVRRTVLYGTTLDTNHFLIDHVLWLSGGQAYLYFEWPDKSYYTATQDDPTMSIDLPKLIRMTSKWSLARGSVLGPQELADYSPSRSWPKWSVRTPTSFVAVLPRTIATFEGPSFFGHIVLPVTIEKVLYTTTSWPTYSRVVRTPGTHDLELIRTADLTVELAQVTVSIPLYIPLLVSGVASVCCLLPLTIRRRRRKLGLCVKCGYDLRGSADRCPECGTAFQQGNPTRSGR